MALQIESKAYSAEVGERSDWAVRAFAVAACVPYETARALCECAGRKANQGTPWRALKTVAAELVPGAVPQIARVDFIGDPTLAQFAAAHTTGHYVVILEPRRWSHAVALIDGVVHDHARYSWRGVANGVANGPRKHAGARRRVMYFFKFV